MFDSEVFLEDSGFLILKFIAVLAMVGMLYCAVRWYRLRGPSVWCLVLVLGYLALAGAIFMFEVSVFIAETQEISTDVGLYLIVAMGAMFAAGVACLVLGNVLVERALETRRRLMSQLQATSADNGLSTMDEPR